MRGKGCPTPFLDRNMGAVHESPSPGRHLPTTGLALKHVERGVEPYGLPRALRTHETGRPSALDQGFEAGPQYGDAAAAHPHVLGEGCDLLTLCNLLCYIALGSSIERWHGGQFSRRVIVPGWFFVSHRRSNTGLFSIR
jgi:hypothetical protein